MGIYINGMEMPKEIEPALVIDFCEGLDGKRYARFYHYRYGGLTDWHEVIEMPEPHGRTIDAAPTIIPAEGVYGQYTDTAGNFHWCGTHSGEHTIKAKEG